MIVHWAKENGSIETAIYHPEIDTVHGENISNILQELFSQYSHIITCIQENTYIYQIVSNDANILNIYINAKGLIPDSSEKISNKMHIQIDSKSLNYLLEKITKGFYGILLGIYQRDNQFVFCAWKIAKADVESPNNIIKHINIQTIATAMKYGFAQQKENNEYICAFRKEFIFFYLHNQWWIHNNGTSNYYGNNYLATSVELDAFLNNNGQFNSYFSAIRTKPFLILAGISGTGKSRLARRLAQATATGDLVNYQKPGNYELIPVKPNWHDSSELLGYVSRISKYPKYVMTDFVCFLFKAMLYPEVPFFLCLDEMNLAPIEQYFAEYLSVIETRAKISDRMITTDVLVKFDDEIYDLSVKEQLEKYCTYLGKTEVFEQVSNTIKKDGGLRIPPNLIVIGTVNMDESTFSFSRKVLDRAMSFELDVINLREELEEDNTVIPQIPREFITPTLVSANDVYKALPAVADAVLDRLQRINNTLDGTPFKIAYRSRNEIMIYVYERLKDIIKVKFFEENSVRTSALFHQALDEVISMKILSRIEGDEQKISVNFLNNLVDAITGDVQIVPATIVADRINQEEYTINALQNESKPYLICSKKIKQMKEQLKNGYVSFWS